MVATHHLRKSREDGFTLIELMIVIAIIAVLSGVAIPLYLASIRRANEAALREDLQTMRQAIDSYTADKEKGPQSLDDLVQGGYLKSIPVDPITHHSDTWIASQSDTLVNIEETQGGITDVHSGAQGQASDGTIYSGW